MEGPVACDTRQVTREQQLYFQGQVIIPGVWEHNAIKIIEVDCMLTLKINYQLSASDSVLRCHTLIIVTQLFPM